jgi:hypothetical protein
MSNSEKPSFEKLKPLIDSFCEVILTFGDKYDDNKAKQYINNLSDDDKRNLNANLNDLEIKEQFDFILQGNIIKYIKSYEISTDLIKRPFEFDTIVNHRNFLNICKKYYGDCNQGAPLPSTLECTIEYIHDSAEHYKIFSEFYDAHSNESAAKIIKDITSVAEKKAEEAVKTGIKEVAKEAAYEAANLASSKAQAFSEIASKSAETAMKDAKGAAKIAAEEATKIAVENGMNSVTKHISETSVTILGIFSGIILTVVAGLFYSSSVLDNINSANYFRLISVTALVGIVCFDLIALMFSFIQKLSKQTDDQDAKIEKTNKLYSFIKWLNVFLFIVMFVGGILQFVFPTQEKANTLDATNISGQISVNLNENSNPTNNSDIETTATQSEETIKNNKNN